MKRAFNLIPLLALLLMAACADEPPGGVDDVTEDTSFDSTIRDTGVVPDEDAAVDTTSELDGVEIDTGADAADESEEDTADGGVGDLVLDGDLATCADDDNDGFQAEGCGGRDCDDDNRFIHPDAREFCDYDDNNCDGAVNEDLRCTFLAHTPDSLYRIDPFLLEAELVTIAPDLWDMDLSPDGTVYAISEEALYRFDREEAEWVEITSEVSAPGDTNGMAIDLTGVAFLTSGNRLLELDLETGDTSVVGRMGPGFESSGDIVINKGGTLYMSSRTAAEGEPDFLVIIDSSTGLARTIGSIGFDKVYGMTAAWGFLFGLTADGEVVSINPETGEGELVATFPSLAFGGSASASER